MLWAKEGANFQPRDAAVFPLLNDQTVAVLAIDLTSPGVVEKLRTFLDEADSSGHRVFKQTMLKALSGLIPATSGSSSPNASQPVDQAKTVYVVAIWSNVMGLFTDGGRAWLDDDPRAQRNHELGRSLFLVVPGASRNTVEQLHAAFADNDESDKTNVWDCREIGDCAVVAEPRLVERLATQQTSARPELAKALAAAGRKPLRLAIAAPPRFAQAAREILKSPVSDDGRPLGQYLAEVSWAAVGIELTESGTIAEIVVQSTGRARRRGIGRFSRHGASPCSARGWPRLSPRQHRLAIDHPFSKRNRRRPHPLVVEVG